MTNKLLLMLTSLALLVAACGSASTEPAAIEAAERPTAVSAVDESIALPNPAHAAAGDGAAGDGAAGTGAAGEPETDNHDPAPAAADSAGDGAGDGVGDSAGDSEVPSVGEPAAPNDAPAADEPDGVLGALLFGETNGLPTAARFEGTFTAFGRPDEAFPDAVSMHLSGAYDAAEGTSRVSMDMVDLVAAVAATSSSQIPPGMESFFKDPLQIVQIGGQGWIKWGIFALFVGQADVWLELEPSQIDETTANLGFSTSAGDPGTLLKALAGANASVEDLGVESINGVSARHWRAYTDLEQLAASATPEERAELASRFGDLSASGFPIDVWIGTDDGLVHRFTHQVANDAFFDDVGGNIQSATMVFDFFDHGNEQVILAPPAAEVISGASLFGR